MTITTTTIKNSYSGNGSNDTFAYTFKISTTADIEVVIRSSTGLETVKTITTHYTVTGAGEASGGNVVFTSGNIPSATETVVIRRDTTQTQTLDLVENDPFTADSVEGAFDKNLSISQELQEQINRCIKFSKANTFTSADFTESVSDRSGKVLGFDTAGELAVTNEIGSNKGNWAASTAYGIRDIVKDTNTNNIFMANTAHTSSGSLPLTSNTDSAKWDLLVDAATATTSATNAANSASTASTQATNASNSAPAAASSAAAAAASADSFDDTYLGAKASDPSTDNDGDALNAGDLYFNTSSNAMRVYNGSAWEDVAVSTSGFATNGFSIAMSIAL